MKKFLFRILLLLIFSLAVFTFLFGYYRLDEKHLAVLKVNDSGKVLKVFSEKNAFVYQGLMPWLYNVEIISIDMIDDFSVSLVIPELKGLKNVNNAVHIPLSLRYRINRDTFTSIELLEGKGRPLKDYVRKIVKGKFYKAFYSYLYPVYRGYLLDREQQKLLEDARTDILEYLSGYNISVVDMSVSGPVIIPGNREYLEGLKYVAELKRIQFQNRKEMEKLNSRLKQEKLKEKMLFEKYRQMSRLLRDNPFILKYIYIDKLADDLKVIISSDKTGMPLFLNSNEAEKKPVENKGEIDNLR